MTTSFIADRVFRQTWYHLALMLALLRFGSLRADSPSPKVETRSVRDIAYYEGPDADKTRHKLDLFLPKGVKDFPVLIFVHGGAWHRGDKSFLGVYGALGTFYARQGIGTVVINYRLSPAVKHPEHIKDVARAVAWTSKNIGNYGGDPKRIILSGHSAGAHLVALLAAEPSFLKAEGFDVSALRGVIGISGPYNLDVLPERLAESAFSTDPAVLNAASPTKVAHGKLPPFLLLYADNDMPGCDEKSSLDFADALRKAGAKVEAHEIRSSSHYKIILSAAVNRDPVSSSMLKFIQEQTTR